MKSPRALAPRVAALAVVAALGGVLAPACSLGEGKGSLSGQLSIPGCWAGDFDLKPDFFAAVPYSPKLIVRIQSGGDYQDFSDGLSILVDDVTRVQLNQAMKVSLSPAVTPPGVPVLPVADPSLVHAALYLQRTCRVQNVALYAVDAVTLAADGSCKDDRTTSDGGSATSGAACGALGLSDAGPDGSSPLDAGPAPSPLPARPTGSSWIRFASISNADPDEPDASKRLNDGDFELYLADPREICPGGVGPPPPCRGHLKGNFKFYFQRGKPAQPFP